MPNLNWVIMLDRDVRVDTGANLVSYAFVYRLCSPEPCLCGSDQVVEPSDLVSNRDDHFLRHPEILSNSFIVIVILRISSSIS